MQQVLIRYISGLQTWVGPVGPRGVVQDEDGREVSADGREVLGVRPEVEGAVLAVVSPGSQEGLHRPQSGVRPVEHALVTVQLVRHGRPVDLHAGGEDHQLEPLGHLRRVQGQRWTDISAETHHREEEVDVRPLVDEEADRVPVYRHLQRLVCLHYPD